MIDCNSPVDHARHMRTSSPFSFSSKSGTRTSLRQTSRNLAHGFSPIFGLPYQTSRRVNNFPVLKLHLFDFSVQGIISILMSVFTLRSLPFSACYSPHHDAFTSDFVFLTDGCYDLRIFFFLEMERCMLCQGGFR
jgi:hypothetical protein